MLGTPKENITWMGYDDGMLEYAPQPKLTEEATAIIRRVRPDVLLSVDPGEWYERWHKTDHRMAAFNTIDAVRAAEFWLYFPNQRLQQGLEPYKVPEMYFFYPSPQEANYFVNIESVAELKFEVRGQASKPVRACGEQVPSGLDGGRFEKSEGRDAQGTAQERWALRRSLSSRYANSTSIELNQADRPSEGERTCRNSRCSAARSLKASHFLCGRNSTIPSGGA